MYVDRLIETDLCLYSIVFPNMTSERLHLVDYHYLILETEHKLTGSHENIVFYSPIRMSCIITADIETN